jgi:hypothetical protein
MNEDEKKQYVKKLLSKPPIAEKIDTIRKAVEFKKCVKKANSAKSEKSLDQSLTNLRRFYE